MEKRFSTLNRNQHKKTMKPSIVENCQHLTKGIKHHARVKLVALLFVAPMVFQADAAYLYSLDDGRAELTLGPGEAGTMAWGNMFSVNAVDGAYLQSIEIGYNSGVAGSTATWRVFNDDDGDPTSGLVELASGTYTVTADGPNNINVIPTGTVDVTGAPFLFIATEVTYTNPSLKPAIQDTSSGGKKASWLGFVPTGETFTWADGFLTEDIPVTSLNWIIRGNAVPEPSADPYVTWATGGELFGDDANGDGVSNGLAFLLGASGPNVSALGLLPTSTEDGSGGLVLTFTMLDSASRGTAALTVEWSSDLGISDPWSGNQALVPDATPAPQVPPVDFQISGSGTLAVTATIGSVEAGGSGKLFGRLKATE